jgi:uncharacterized repeat protein (TIGR01451 family)
VVNPVTPETPNTPNIELSKAVYSTSTTPLTPGATITYVLTVTNTGLGTQKAPYQFHEVVPNYTTYASFTVLSPIGADVQLSGCAVGDAAGARCSILVNQDIPKGASVKVLFTVKLLNSMPAGVSKIVNQVYYDEKPTRCTTEVNPDNDPSCNEVCTGNQCTPPTECTDPKDTNPLCRETPLPEPRPAPPAPTPVPALDAFGTLLLSLLMAAGGLLLRRRVKHAVK